MEINTPAQQAEAAQHLRWNWSDATRDALTKYCRDMEDELTLEMMEHELIRATGATSAFLLDVQRELGGVTIDYGGNQNLDLGVSIHADLFKECDEFLFTWNHKGYPEQFIDIMGRVRDGSFMFSNPQKFVEWYVHMRNFFLDNFGNANSAIFYPINKNFEEVRLSLFGLCDSLALPINDYASDNTNLLWSNRNTEVTLRNRSNTGSEIFLFTTQLELIEIFKTFWL